MLIVLLSYFVYTYIFYLLGNLMVKCFKSDYSFIETLFIGFSISGSAINIYSIFFPANIYILIVLLIISTLHLVLNFINIKNEFTSTLNYLTKNPFVLITTLIVTIAILLYTIGESLIYDTYLYHLNSIKWNSEFKAVYGLGNLNSRLGFNSSLHVIVAPFTFWFNKISFTLNSYFCLIFVNWIIYNSYKIKNLSILLICFSILFFNLYGRFISSISTDLIPNIVIAYLLLKILIFKDNIYEKTHLYWILPLFIITIKISISAILILNVLVFINFILNKRYKTLITLILISFVVISPWIIRNIIITGYLIYPLYAIDIFNFDWKVPMDVVITEKKWITSWAIIPEVNADLVLQMKFTEWFPIWWKSCGFEQKIILIIGLLTPLLIFIKIIINKSIRNFEHIVLVGIISSIGSVLWFVSAPDFRFAYSYLLLNCTILYVIIQSINFVQNLKISHYFTYLSLVISVLLLRNGWLSFYKNNHYPEFSQNIIEQYQIAEIKKSKDIAFNKVTTSDNITLFMPMNSDQCYDVIPCLPNINNNIKLRGKTIEDGFYTTKK